MTNRPSPSLAELEQRIAIARDNIRQLIEQAAALPLICCSIGCATVFSITSCEGRKS
jgi:hypothetical protein